MPRNLSPQRIRTHLVYTVAEAAERLGVHRKTVLAWIRNHGLIAETHARPVLIRGADLKAFLVARRARDKTKLQPGEFYCLPCRSAQIAAERMAEFQLRTRASGMLTGLCPSCGRLMHRMIRRWDLDLHRPVLDVTIRPALVTLEGAGKLPVNTPFAQERGPDAKAR